MKIMLLTTELAPGGAERIVLELAEGLLRNGDHPVVVSLKAKPGITTIPDKLAELSIPVRYLNASKKNPLVLLKLFRVIHRERPNLIHSHLMHPNLLARLANIFPHRPLVNTIHISDRRPETKNWFRLDRWTVSLCDAYTAVSHASAAFHEEACGFPDDFLKVIPNGSNPVPPASPALCSKLKHLWGLGPCAKILGGAGRMDYQKGYDILLKRLPALRSRIPAGETWGVLLIGDGPELPALRRLADTVATDSLRIALPGYRADASALMAMFDVFLMPSRYEGYGLALVEAMSQGLPVVCNAVDSLPELCWQYHGKSLLIKMDTEMEGHIADYEFADAILSAVKAGKGVPQTLRTCDEMCRDYLALYQNVSLKLAASETV